MSAAAAPHPRETLGLRGHGAAEATFTAAWASGRLHHAWMLRGPRGVGKATLAYRIARAVIAGGDPAAGLALPAEHPVARRVAAGSEPRLKALERGVDPKTKRLRSEIVVDDVRAAKRFLQLSAADGGWRVVVVDRADEMTVSAANALLKVLEEPPPRALLLLAVEAAGRLPPTIRSRARLLDLAPLSPGDLADALADAGAAPGADAATLAALAGGSPGEALRLGGAAAPKLYAEIAGLAATAPVADRAAVAALAEAAAGRGGAERFALTADLITLLARRLALTAAGAPGVAPLPAEAAAAARLAAGPAAARIWADAAAETARRAARAAAVNLDPGATILDTWRVVDDAAARAVA